MGREGQGGERGGKGGEGRFGQLEVSPIMNHPAYWVGTFDVQSSLY